MKSIFKRLGALFCLAVMLIALNGCGSSSDSDLSINISDPEEIVPDKETLVENLEDAGYTITEYTSISSSSLVIDRVVAEKGKKFIDITYGLTSENAGEIFNAYCDLYDDYYILAQNGNYVYCVSDKKTFSKAGFTSTANIGIQYIND